MHRRGVFLQQLQRAGVAICGEDRSLGGVENSSDGTEDVVDRSSFVAAVDHAVGALGVAGFGAVVFPVGRFHQFGKGIGVAVLQQVTGLLPAEDVVGGHAPGSAGVVALAHEEFEEQRRHG